MPKARSGSLTLTPTQYRCFERWATGDFEDDWNSQLEPRSTSYNSVCRTFLIEKQPAALTRAALEACVGGSFKPGIEVGDTVAQPDTYEQPFRISPHYESR